MTHRQPRISLTGCVQEIFLCVCVCAYTVYILCVYVLLAKLQNSGSTLVVIDSLEAVSAAGKSYLQLYCEEEGRGEGESINKSSKDWGFQYN